MASSIVITNVNNKTYTFLSGEVNSSRFGIVTKLFKMPIPEDSGEKAIVINLGKEKIISAEFKLLNLTGQDASSGTHTSIVDTISKKLDYLEQTFLTSGANDIYIISLTTHTGSILNKKGIIDNFNFNFSGNNPNSLTGTISFNIGGANQQ